MATAFGGLAQPPLRFKGMLVRKNVHRFCLSHSAARASRSNISPIGIPIPASSVGCMPFPNAPSAPGVAAPGGHASNPGQSPATAAICVSHRNCRTETVDSIPMYSNGDLDIMVSFLVRAADSHALVKPVRRNTISPGRNLIPLDAAIS